MKAIDYVKAAGVAVALLVLNLMIGLGAVVIHRFVIEPGHPSDFYDAAALSIVPKVVHISEPLSFLAAGYIFTRSRPTRNGYAFAFIFTGLFIIFDAACLGFAGIASATFLIAMLANLLAAEVGASIAYRRSRMTPETRDNK